MKVCGSRGWIVALYLLLPPAMLAAGPCGLRWILPILVILGAVCWRTLPRPVRKAALDPRFLKEQARTILIRWLAGGLLLAAAVRVFRPEVFLALPRENPRLWLAVCFLYPLGSALPQEVIYRAFFADRAARHWPGLHGRAWIAVNAAVFAYAHLAFGNAWAVLCAAAGGCLFASTYARNRSVLCAAVEHALWGVWFFTLGLGGAFRGGTVALLLGG
jgi:hypothetical protein